MPARWRTALAALLLTLAASSAEAHASLLLAQPADGVVLQAAPRQVVLQFDEPVEPLQLTLTSPTGERLVLQPRAEGARLTAELPQALARGSYALNYRVVSADSHPVGGSLMFAVGAADALAPVAAAAAAAAVQDAGWWLVLVRGLRDAALLLAAGLALFVLGVARLPRERTILRSAALVALVLGFASLLLQGVWLIGPGTGSFGLGSWKQALNSALNSSFGTSMRVALAGLACLLLSTVRGRQTFRLWLLAPGAALSLLSFALTGHAAASSARFLAGAALSLHVLAVAFWLGSLLGLIVLLRGEREAAIRALARFSRVAVAMVAVLLAAGIVLACLQLSSFAELLYTRYGLLILLKSALLMVLLMLATLNRYRWVPRLEQLGQPLSLRRSVTAEIVLVLGVLMVTAALVQTSPHAMPWRHALTVQGQNAELTIERDATHDETVVVRMSDAQGLPLNPAAVELVLSNPRLGIENLHRGLSASGPGRFVYGGHELLSGGDWQVQVRARIDDFDERRWDFNLQRAQP